LGDLGLDGGDDQHAADGDHYPVLNKTHLEIIMDFLNLLFAVL
jgi:hypothetical protein